MYIRNRTKLIENAEWKQVICEGLPDEAWTISWCPLCYNCPLAELFSKQTVLWSREEMWSCDLAYTFFATFAPPQSMLDWFCYCRVCILHQSCKWPIFVFTDHISWRIVLTHSAGPLPLPLICRQPANFIASSSRDLQFSTCHFSILQS